MAKTGVREHTIGRDVFHFKWDNSLPPAVEIESGDIVHFDTEEVTAGQLKKGDPASKLGALNFDRLYPLGGPVYVKGAEPGDALEVDILSLKPGSWGWSAILPGLGLLASDFPDPYVRYFDLGDRTTAELRHDIHIPLAPFCGTMGVATDEPGPHDVRALGPALMENARNSVRDTIGWLQADHKRSGEDAYILCSLAGDLRISQIVDQPNFGVSFYMPLSVFS